MTDESEIHPSLEDLVAAAKRARAGFDWEALLSHSSQALARESIAPEAADALLDGRVEAHRHLGDLSAEEADLEAMARLAAELGDAQRQAQVVLRQADLRYRQGRLTEARSMAQAALDAARQRGDRALEAPGLLALGMTYVQESRFDEGRGYAEQAAALSHALGDAVGEAWALLWLSFADSRQERAADAGARLEAALELFRQGGDREGEARALNGLGISSPDLAQKRALYEQALAAFDAIGDRPRQAMVYNNLAMANSQMGLYTLARDHASRAVESARRMGARGDLAYYLDTLARVCLEQGDVAAAEELFQEGMLLSREIGDHGLEAAYAFGLARAAHGGGRLAEACDLYRVAEELFGHVGIPAEQAACLAWLGAVNLDLGDVESALADTAQAMSLLESVEGAAAEYPPQETWWWRCRALSALPTDATGGTEAADDAWHALDGAREAMLAGIANLSDDGLRRNYLNKVPINRKIIDEWLREAARRGAPLAPLIDGLAGPGGGQEQFRRMLDIGLRLNARHETGGLSRFIVDQVVELTGAERVVLYRLDETGRRQVAAQFAVEGSPPTLDITLLLDKVSLKRQAVLQTTPPDVPELEQRSLLCVPLVASGKLVGLVYADMAGVYGRFTDRDRDLLTALANQAAVALENTAWAESLERRVQERTAELQAANAQLSERTAELEVINRVQQGLATQLDMQAKYDLVGDEIRNLFDAQALLINTYDQAAGLQYLRYHYERGQRFCEEPTPISGIGRHLIRTHQMLLFNEDAGRHWQEFGLELTPGTEMPRSMLYVPLIAGDQVRGSISLQDLDREHAFSEADVRLLTTLATSMGVALENARLFAETNRLLEETRQRAAELTTVNRISQALASQLDREALIHLVGDQVRSAFQADITYVALLDRQAGLISFPYQCGEQYDTLVLGQGLTSRILQTGEPLLINQDIAGRRAELGIQPIGKESKSYLGVPIAVGQEVIGVLSVQSTGEEGRFDEDDLRLLSTIAANVGAALHNARLYQETQRRATEMAALAEVGREISSTLDLPVVLERIAGQACELLAGATSAVYLLQPDGHTLRAITAEGDIAQEVLADEVELGQGIVGQIVENGVAERIDDTTSDPRGVHIPGTKETPHGEKLMVAPLLVYGRALGALAVWRNPPDPPFNEAELSFSSGLAQQAAVAIENARLFSEVQEQKSFSEALVQNIPVAIVTATGGSAVTSWNPAAERLFGYARDEVIGQDLDALITTPEICQEARLFTEQTMAGDPVHTVTRRRRKDGSPVDVELLSVMVRIAGQEPGYVAIYHDITELTQATRAIEESQRRMADIIDFLPDATLVIDRDGKVIAWNRAIEEMTGVKAAEMLGKGDHEYALPFYGERRPILIDLVLLPDEEIETKYAHLQRDGATLTGEALVPQLRGGPAYLYATASALRNSRGEMAGAIETIRDISDRKHAEEELRQAKAAAEAATQAKSAFLATMSHEIRTPMNAVIGMTSLLLDTGLTPEQREFAETIRTSGDALLAVINDILDFSKIEAGRIDLEHQPFDLRQCVEGAVGLVAGQAAEKGLELSCWIDPRVPAGIAGDETRLRQIVLNLLSNAVKFTAQGEVVVSVNLDDGRQTMGKTADRPSPVVHLDFSVRDTGPGIPPDRMDRLFQSFSQVDSSTTRKYGGTGLGLAISMRLVELMGGRMWAESAGVPGQGSTFYFTIPAQPAPIPARPELQAAPADLRGRRVLIVDDSATSRRILSLQAGSWGLEPRATGSPGEALDWIRHGEPFDVAILDRQMPEMDGVMLAAEIRKLRDAKALPLVMVSSLGPHEASEETEQAWAAFLVKPVRASQLYNTLVRILARREAEEVRPGTAAPAFDAEMGQRQPLRILLAEDNVVNQKLALRLLERLGYRADVAANGVEAIRALERQPYDVVFMDVQMPEMDGLEATRQIVGRWLQAQRPRIIAMTANALAEDREACLAAGMDDYLAKPIRVEELVAALSRCQPLKRQS